MKDERTTLAIRPCQRGIPTANSLQANARAEFAVTAYSISFSDMTQKNQTNAKIITTKKEGIEKILGSNHE
jgi:hypothetical protein